jgi:hypothetical protein
MRELLALIAVALLANVAMATPGFDIVPNDPIAISTGDTVAIPIATTGTGTIGGMELYLQVSPGYEIVGLQAANIGGLFTSPGNTVAEQLYVYPDRNGVLPNSQYAMDFVSITADLVNVPRGSIVAQVLVRAIPGMPVGWGFLTTNTDVSPSNFAKGEVSEQDTVRLIPEPVTAMLLLAAVPVLGRRRS